MLHNDYSRGTKNLLSENFELFLNNELMQSAEKILNKIKPALKPYKISEVFNNKHVGILGPKVEVYLVDEDKMPVVDIPISDELINHMEKEYEKDRELFNNTTVTFNEQYDPCIPNEKEKEVISMNGEDYDEETKRKRKFKERYEWWNYYYFNPKKGKHASKALGCYWPLNKEIWICYDLILSKGLSIKQTESLTANVFIHELAHALMDTSSLLNSNEGGYANEYELWLEESLANKIMLEYLTAYDTHQDIIGKPSIIDLAYTKDFVLRQLGPYRIGWGLFVNDSADWALYKEYKDSISVKNASQWIDYVSIYHYTEWHPVTERKLYYPIFPKRAIYKIEVGGTPAANMKDAVKKVALLYITTCRKTISDLEPDLGIKAQSTPKNGYTELKDPKSSKTFGYINLQNLTHGVGSYFDDIVKNVEALKNPALKITCTIQKRP